MQLLQGIILFKETNYCRLSDKDTVYRYVKI